MENQKYLEYFRRLLEILPKVINPFEEDVKTGAQKVTKMFKWLVFSHVSMFLLLVVFCNWNFGIKEATTLTEAVALAVINVREWVYLFLIYIYHEKISEMLQKIITTRKAAKTDDGDQMKLTLKYCKLEVLVACLLVPSDAFFLFLSATLGVYLFPNEYSLPINANIVFIPFDSFHFIWAITFAYQLTYLTAAAILFFSYVVMNLILLNQTCWYFDSAFLMIKNLTKEDAGGSQSVMKKVLDKQAVKEFVEFCCEIAEWQDDVQTIMQFSLLSEITLLSSIFCLCFFNVSFFTAVLLLTGVSQLFLYCWFGTRERTKAEKLTFALYDLNWYQLSPLERKTILILMTNAQNAKGLGAIFMDINFETFQTIMEFSYSLLALLHSTI